jgi:hypothetical protein
MNKLKNNIGIIGKTSTMWRYIPIDEKSFKPHREYRAIHEKYPGTEIIAASVRGKKHKHEGTNRDDWFETVHIGDWTFITLADGAGSKKLSRIGAKLACKAAISYIKESFSEFASYETEIVKSLSMPNDSEDFLSTCESLVNIVQTSVVKGYEAVRVYYEKVKNDKEFTDYINREVDIRDFSSTFITSVIIPVFSAEKVAGEQNAGDGKNATGRSVAGDGKNVASRNTAENGKNVASRNTAENGKSVASGNTAGDGKNVAVRNTAGDGNNVVSGSVADDRKNVAGRSVAGDGNNVAGRSVAGDGNTTASGNTAENGRSVTGGNTAGKKDEILIINCHIGDGLATAVDSNAEYEKSVKIIGNVGNNDARTYAGETEFLTDTNLHTAAELSKRTKIYRGKADTVMFMSDGVSDDYFPYEEGMAMLWLDLAANGIIPVGKAIKRGVSKVVSKIPRPISFPWVNDNNIRFSFQSAKKICDSAGILPKELWDNRGLLTVKFPFVTVMGIQPKEERLKFFIDNYTVRGSFDDRTLLIYLNK